MEEKYVILFTKIWVLHWTEKIRFVGKGIKFTSTPTSKALKKYVLFSTKKELSTLNAEFIAPQIPKLSSFIGFKINESPFFKTLLSIKRFDREISP